MFGKSVSTMAVIMVIFVVLVSLTFSVHAVAQKPSDIESIMNKLEDLQATIEKQQAEIERLKKTLENMKKSQQQVQEEQKTTIQKQVKREVEEQVKPLSWAKKLNLSGDMRLRYEGIYDREKNGNDIDDRHRFRVRLRLYGDADITDEFAAHFMLSTSDTQFGQTSNQSLDDEFDNKALFIARAWTDYRPKWLPELEVGFGKFKNPYLHSDISFDPDVNPEGFYQLYTYKRWKTVQPFAKLGQLIISENNLTKDGSLFLWQGGVKINLAPVKFTLAGSFYDYHNLDRTRLGESDRAKGNTTIVDPESGDSILAYEFKIAEAIAFADFNLKGYPVTVWADYLRNTADEVPDDRDTAWGIGFNVGKLKNPGDWKFEYMYKRIESDAVLGLFADGDFFGTNRKGHRWRVTYSLIKALSLQAAFFETDSVKGDNHENRLQISTIFKF